MDQADKAVLRLAIGLGLAVLVAYGLVLRAPFVVCVMTVLLLCKGGPPIAFLKGAVMAIVIAALLVVGVLMVPVLENYAASGVVLTSVLLYAVFFAGARNPNPLTIILAIALTTIPVAGVADQALCTTLSAAVGVGLGTGVLVSGVSHSFFPDVPARANIVAATAVGSETATRDALQATLVVMPVFILALTNPAFYLAAIVKTVALGQQAGSTSARSAGRELVGSTLVGAWMAALVWLGLSLRPNLWMLMLWMVAAAFWAGARLFGVKTTRFLPSFWSNALVTMLILLGPAIEDSANGKDVFSASAIRIALFVGVALYAWAIVWTLERWSASNSKAILFKRLTKEE
jgi:hypothetical protein